MAAASTICELEHQGSIKTDNNSWNQNDTAGEELATKLTLCVVFAILFLFCIVLILSTQHYRKLLKAFFIILALAFLGAFIAYAVQTGETIKHNPITVIYGFSQYVTKLVRTNPRLNPPDVFPGHVDFENNFLEIQKEVLTLADQKGGEWPLMHTTFGSHNSGFRQPEEEGKEGKEDGKEGSKEIIGWRWFMVSVGERFSPKAEELLPTLTSVIKKNQDRVVSCALSMLPPGVRIPAHTGYTKAVVRYMLPVEVPSTPNSCFLCLNGQAHEWELGKSFAFDDTFTHSVYNNSTQRRIVVYCDILREIPAQPLFTRLSHWFVKNFIQDSAIVKAELGRTEYLVSLDDKQQQNQVEQGQVKS